MRRRMCQVISVAAVILMLFTSAAVAQSARELVGDIPFSFHVGQSTLPAGAYIVKKCTTASGSQYITIRSMDGTKVMMQKTLPTAVGNRDAQPRLIFNRYGSDYFLSRVLSPADGIGQELFKEKREKELALAANGGKASTTDVALATR